MKGKVLKGKVLKGEVLKGEAVGRKAWRKEAVFGLCVLLLFCCGCGVTGRDGADGAGGDASGMEEARIEEGSVQSGEAGEKAGETRVQIPDFTMTLLDGTEVSFAEYQGRKVLMNFWATWCGPCVGEMPAFQRLADEYPGELVIVAVNCGEDSGTVEKFIEENAYTFPVVLDEDGAVQGMFGGMTSIPVTLIIDEEGCIVSSSVGAADADTMYDAYKAALGW